MGEGTHWKALDTTTDIVKRLANESFSPLEVNLIGNDVCKNTSIPLLTATSDIQDT
jgi:hypothetical protein